MNVHGNETSKQKYSDSLQYMSVFSSAKIFFSIYREHSQKRSIQISPRDCSIDVDFECTFLDMPRKPACIVKEQTFFFSV